MACVYLCHDVEGLPRYVGEGKPERPIDHIKTEPNGLGDFYARMRRESAAGRLVRWRYLWWDLAACRT